MKTTRKYEQNISTARILAVTSLFAVFSLAGCQQEGAVEKAGQKLDQSIEGTGKKIEKMTEKAGKEIRDAKNEAGKSITETTEASGQYIDDSVITVSVKAAILNDPLLKVSQIKVTTKDGIVQLSGVLDSQESIERAGEIAKNQKDVKSVQNDLILIASTSSEE
jgi:hyperosmotically inducible protein